MAADVPKGDSGYAAEKLGMAVYRLATGHGRIRDRLYDAFMVFHPVNDRDIPPPLLPLWREVRDGLTCKSAKHPREGAINATLRGMRTEEAERIARRICELADRLDEHLIDAASSE